MLSLDTGERIGWVEDLLIDTSRQCVSGLLVKKGTFASQIVLPFRETTVGADAVIVRTATTFVTAREWVDEGRATYRSRDLYGKEVVTGDGTRLGFVHDALVEQHMDVCTRWRSVLNRAARPLGHSLSIPERQRG